LYIVSRDVWTAGEGEVGRAKLAKQASVSSHAYHMPVHLQFDMIS